MGECMSESGKTRTTLLWAEYSVSRIKLTDKLQKIGIESKMLK
jgi:hypothetical protein